MVCLFDGVGVDVASSVTMEVHEVVLDDVAYIIVLILSHLGRDDVFICGGGLGLVRGAVVFGGRGFFAEAVFYEVFHQPLQIPLIALLDLFEGQELFDELVEDDVDGVFEGRAVEGGGGEAAQWH